MTKSELRKLYLDKRQELSEVQVAQLSRCIADRFFDTFDLSSVRTLHTFLSIPKFHEVDTELIYSRVWKQHPHITTVAPSVDKVAGILRNRPFSPSTDFSIDAWGIREPTGDQFIEPVDLDLVIVPALYIDKAGHRVGYGKGYYDKLLAGCREDCLKVGVIFFTPGELIEDLRPGDFPLDHCVTPDAVLDFT